jgi:hypothetical protein
VADIHKTKYCGREAGSRHRYYHGGKLRKMRGGRTELEKEKEER